VNIGVAAPLGLDQPKGRSQSVSQNLRAVELFCSLLPSIPTHCLTKPIILSLVPPRGIIRSQARTPTVPHQRGYAPGTDEWNREGASDQIETGIMCIPPNASLSPTSKYPINPAPQCVGTVCTRDRGKSEFAGLFAPDLVRTKAGNSEFTGSAFWLYTQGVLLP
jgi:hypothetical protein